MKPRTESAQAPRTYPVQQISAEDLLRHIDEHNHWLLIEDAVREAMNHYGDELHDWREKLKHAKWNEKEKHLFHGATKDSHPLAERDWIYRNGPEKTLARMQKAIIAKDWEDAMVMAGILLTLDMIHGRAAKVHAPAKAKAVRKTAQKKPAAKKPATTKKAAPGKVATLKDLVAQAKPLFAKNPKLDRQGLINKIGRRYERLTTFDELRTLCAGKTVTTHSVKKATPPTGKMDLGKIADWPFPTDSRAPAASKAKRPRRDPAPKAGSFPPSGDPARPVAAPEASIPKGVRTKPWPQPDRDGRFTTDQADHVADFGAGKVAADFAVIETSDGWTYGFTVKVGDRDATTEHLRDDGLLAPDADTAIRDVSSRALGVVKTLLSMAGSKNGQGEDDITPHLPDLEKLRSWLLGFQVRGVEKIAFLNKGGQLELAA